MRAREIQSEIKTPPIYQEYNYPKISQLIVEKKELVAQLFDKREVSIPKNWLQNPNFFNLNNASDEQLKRYEILADGKTIYWPDLDEYLHVRTFIDGLEARCCW